MPDAGRASRAFWDRAARKNAAWYVATEFSQESPQFFTHGATEADALLGLCGVTLAPTDRLLELGCGVGRMTRHLSELAAEVTAVDVSGVMLERCARNLQDRANVRLLRLPGDGSMSAVPTGSVDVVFSYITMQHVPTRAAQVRYLQEAARVLAPGGRLAVQIRGRSLTARALDWAGHLAHLAQRRATLSRAWRGARLSDAAVRNSLDGPGLQVEIRRFNRRHRWVLARRRAEPER